MNNRKRNDFTIIIKTIKIVIKMSFTFFVHLSNDIVISFLYWRTLFCCVSSVSRVWAPAVCHKLIGVHTSNRLIQRSDKNKSNDYINDKKLHLFTKPKPKSFCCGDQSERNTTSELLLLRRVRTLPQTFPGVCMCAILVLNTNCLLKFSGALALVYVLAYGGYW